MPQRPPLSSGLCGVAGEYYVAAELSRRGYVASLTLRNTRGIDILVSDVDARWSAGIQVKTSQRPGVEWVLSKKAEAADLADNLFFVFVSLNDGGVPSYHIVPKRVVAEYVSRDHARWLATPGRDGRAHRDNPIRKFKDATGEYHDRWDLFPPPNRTA